MKRIPFWEILLAALFICIVFYLGGFYRLELMTMDTRMNLAGPRTPPPDIVMVTIDEDSFTHLRRKWPWPPTYHARVIDRIASLGAKVISFDISFAEPGPEPAEDILLGRIIARAGNVVASVFTVPEPVLPINPVWDNASGIAFVDLLADPDGVVRRIMPVADLDPDPSVKELRQPALTLGLEVYRQAFEPEGKLDMTDSRFFRLGALRVPLDRDGGFFIRYCGGGGTFTSIPYYKVLSGEVEAGQFKDKLVIIGATAQAFHDNFSTPFRAGDMQTPGMEIHANVLGTLMGGRFLFRFPVWISLILILVLTLLSGFLIFLVGPEKKGVFLLAAVLLLVLLGSYFLYTGVGLILDLVPMLAGPSFEFIVLLGVVLSREKREKAVIRETFGKYVSESVQKWLMENPGYEQRLGGEMRDISILFADINDFVPMTESLGAEATIRVLNEYFTRIVEIISRHGGTVKQFVGDEIMIMFGAPADQPEHAKLAVRSAIDMINDLKKFQAEREARGERKFWIKIGLNCGLCVCGNIGSLKRMEYSVIGDVVNFASRIMGQNKACDTTILVSPSIYERTRDEFDYREQGSRKLKGKAEEMLVYELLGRKDSPSGLRVNYTYGGLPREDHQADTPAGS
jgi:adenylate cyclase